VPSALAQVLRVASVALCLIVVASFTLFAVNQTSSASNRQQEYLSSGVPATATRVSIPGSPAGAASHESTVRKVIDEAAGEITSPFSAVTSGSNSEWVVRGVGLLLALVVYGFGLGFLARFIRVRV
jgi:hypothetical protein